MASKAPRVSIGMPVHDGERYLRSALDALLCQTFADFEVIIVDNASTDDTEAICSEYAGADPRVRYLRNPTDVGSLRNFNLTFEHACGAYFKWAAHDDLVEPEFLTRCLEVLERDPEIVLCHSHIRIIDERDRTVGHYHYRLGHASDARPSARFRDALAEDRWCFELYGVVRTATLRTTQLLGGYAGTDRRLLAELALRGRLQSFPTTCLSAATIRRARCDGFRRIICARPSKIPHLRADACYRIGGFLPNTRAACVAGRCPPPSEPAATSRSRAGWVATIIGRAWLSTR